MIRFFDDFTEGDDIRNNRLKSLRAAWGLGHGWAGYSQERERILARKGILKEQLAGSSILTINLAKKRQAKIIFMKCNFSLR